MGELMLARATTVVDILRDPDTDDDSGGYGNLSESGDTVVESGIPASVIEQTQRRPDPTSGDLVPVTALIGRVGSRYDVQKGDRLRDRSDGTIYAVTQVSHPQSPVRVLDKRLELSRV